MLCLASCPFNGSQQSGGLSIRIWGLPIEPFLKFPQLQLSADV